MSKKNFEDDIQEYVDYKPRISVVVPVYNASEFLEATLITLLGQSLKEIEVILVNDGSTDDSLEICRSFTARDPRFSVVNQPNRGVSSARNAGIEMCRGDYIAFVDADDLLPQNSLATRLHLIEKYEVDCLRTEFRIMRGEVFQPSSRRYVEGVYSAETVKKIQLDIAMGKTPGYIHPFLLSSSWVEKHKLRFPEGISMMEDTLFLCELLQGDISVYISNEETYEYRLNPKGATLSLERLPQKITSIIAVNQYVQSLFTTSEYARITGVHLRIIASMFLVRFDKSPYSRLLRESLATTRKALEVKKMQETANLSHFSFYDRAMVNVVFHQSFPVLLTVIFMRKIAGKK